MMKTYNAQEIKTYLMTRYFEGHPLVDIKYNEIKKQLYFKISPIYYNFILLLLRPPATFCVTLLLLVLMRMPFTGIAPDNHYIILNPLRLKLKEEYQQKEIEHYLNEIYAVFKIISLDSVFLPYVTYDDSYLKLKILAISRSTINKPVWEFFNEPLSNNKYVLLIIALNEFIPTIC